MNIKKSCLMPDFDIYVGLTEKLLVDIHTLVNTYRTPNIIILSKYVVCVRCTRNS